MNGEFSLTHAWGSVLSSNQTVRFWVHLATGWIVSLSAQKLSQNGKNQVVHPQVLAFHSHTLLATDGIGGTLSITNDNAIQSSFAEVFHWSLMCCFVPLCQILL